VFIVPADEEVDRLAADTRFFMAALEGASAAALQEAVKTFPSLQIDPYRNLAPHFGVASARAAALHGIAAGTARVVIASGAALLPRLSPPDSLESAAIELKPGMDLDPVALGDLLADAGFTREDPVDEHGEFCVRGGIVDYPPARTIRCVWSSSGTPSKPSGATPSTQRSIETIDQASVVPLTEKSGSATFFDYLPDDRDLAFVLREEEEITAQTAKVVEQIRSSYEDAKEEDPRAPAPEELLLDWEHVAARLDNATRLEQLAMGDVTAAGAAAQDIACQPAVEFRGRIQEWIADVKRMRERGDTVLFVAGTEGRAERTSELLAEYDREAC
jgi:transcription-repair coupling factor (superfamily II helicase)